MEKNMTKAQALRFYRRLARAFDENDKVTVKRMVAEMDAMTNADFRLLQQTNPLAGMFIENQRDYDREKARVAELLS
jgi:hypothetical protein